MMTVVTSEQMVKGWWALELLREGHVFCREQSCLDFEIPFCKGSEIKEGNYSGSTCRKRALTVLGGSRRSLKGNLTTEDWW